MGRIKNRSHADTDWLKSRSREYALGGLSNAAIKETLNETPAVGDTPVTPRAIRDWLLEAMNAGETIEAMHSISFSDVLYLRGRAFKATADTEINRAFIMERAYWWGLYISALHVVLRSALAVEANAGIAPQFIVSNLKQWYADLRALRQLKPKLDMEPEEVDKLEADLDAFEKHYGRNIKLPKETL